MKTGAHIVFICLYFIGCNTETSNTSSVTTATVPTVHTLPVIDISDISAKSGGRILSAGGGTISAKGVCWKKGGVPTTGDSKTADGTDTASFTSTMNGLNPGDTYFVRAYATNEAGTGYGEVVSFSALTGGTVTFDGVTYTTVVIGDREWITKNLAAKNYNDGTPIANIQDPIQFSNTTNGAYCSYQNDNANAQTYGYLYNWYAVNTGKLAPLTGGWRVATESDWLSLRTTIGGALVAGGKLKEAGLLHWNSPNTGATDQYGFTALPGGAVYLGAFSNIRNYGYWWSTKETGPSNGRGIWLRNDGQTMDDLSYPKASGFSVRLVRYKL